MHALLLLCAQWQHYLQRNLTLKAWRLSPTSAQRSTPSAIRHQIQLRARSAFFSGIQLHKRREVGKLPLSRYFVATLILSGFGVNLTVQHQCRLLLYRVFIAIVICCWNSYLYISFIFVDCLLATVWRMRCCHRFVQVWSPLFIYIRMYVWIFLYAWLVVSAYNLLTYAWASPLWENRYWVAQSVLQIKTTNKN